MASILDLLSGAPGGELLADNPYAGIARSLQGNLAPEAKNSSQAFLFPLIQGLAQGVIGNFARDYEEDKLFDYYKNNPLIKALSGQATASNPEGTPEDQLVTGMGPVSSGDEYGALLQANPYSGDRPDYWTPEQGKADLAKGLLAYQTAEREAEAQRDIAKIFQTEQAKALAQQLSKTAEDPYEKLSADEKARYANAPGVINEIESIAARARNLKQSALGFNASKQLAQSEASSIVSEVTKLTAQLRRLQGDTGNAAFGEQAQTLEAVLGDRTAGSDTIAKRLEDTARSLRNIVTSSLAARVRGETEGIAGAFEALAPRAAAATKPNPKDYPNFADYKKAMTAWRAASGS